MWQGMGLYWAWRGTELAGFEPPTKKKIEYATVHYANWKPRPMIMKIAVTVFDDGHQTDVNNKELDWHKQNGAEITMPFTHEFNGGDAALSWRVQ